MSFRIGIINGSLGGTHGNTGAVLKRFEEAILRAAPDAEVRFVHLNEPNQLEDGAVTSKEAQTLLAWSQALVFATGTYWDSWGSPLQRFFEEATALETSEAFIGKPAAAIVTMHSVGGKEVLSRLQGVLSTLGCLIPPMSGLTYSLAAHVALGVEGDHRDDLWQLEDLDIVARNLLAALAQPRANWAAWPVDARDPARRWI